MSLTPLEVRCPNCRELANSVTLTATADVIVAFPCRARLLLIPGSEPRRLLIAWLIGAEQ